MGRFTTSERRGTIAVLLIMALIVAYLTVSHNIGSPAPTPVPDTVKITEPLVTEDAPPSKRHRKHRNNKTDSAKAKKKPHKQPKKKDADKENSMPRQRNVLDETI